MGDLRDKILAGHDPEGPRGLHKGDGGTDDKKKGRMMRKKTPEVDPFDDFLERKYGIKPKPKKPRQPKDSAMWPWYFLAVAIIIVLDWVLK